MIRSHTVVTDNGFDIRKLYLSLFERYYKKIFAYVYCILSHEYFAEEVTQNTFVKLFTRVNFDQLHYMAMDINGKTGLDYFIFRVAKNCIIDFTRSQDYLIHKSKVDLDAVHGNSGEILSDHPFSDEMEAALMSLPPLWEQILRLYVLENYSHEEIAKELSISEGHSKNCLSKAKATLRVALRRHQHQ